MHHKTRRKRLDRTIRRPRILVLGGYGFIGRYTVHNLLTMNVDVLVSTRGTRTHRSAPDSIIERKLKLHESVTTDAWNNVLADVDVVINAVGILRERHTESFEQVHHLAVSALARACLDRNVPLIHMSALGIDKAVKSEFSLSKLRGEKCILNSGCHGAIVRASVVDAPDGYGSGWLYRVANWPVWLMPAGATKLISPIDANDLGEALAKIAISAWRCSRPATVLELGCGEDLTLETYLLKLRKPHLSGKPYRVIRVAGFIARLSAHVLDLFNMTPYSIGHHELLEFDNIPTHNHLPRILERAPTGIGNSVRSNHGKTSGDDLATLITS